jgi:DNA-binding TFAR19-related protein (PDSD5 family)
MDARLTLVAMCRDEEADAVNAYLTNLAQLPAAAKP